MITPGSSVSCNNGIGHTDNSYWRAFTLPTFGIVSQFNVSSVQVGVEKAEAASGLQSITVRLYRTTSGVFPTGTRNLLSSANFNVTDQSGTIINVPITANVPAGSELIVEVFTPNGQAGSNLFFIGSNAAAESGPSYISAASCDVTNPTPTAAINFPNDIVLNVVGCQQVEGAGSIIVSAGATLVSESCTPPNGAIDPGETVTVSFCVQNTGNVNTTNLVGTLQATGGVTSPSGPQNYGVVVAGGPAVCRNFTFTATGTCGGTLTATIQMQDGATSLGNVTYTFTFGTQAVAFSENFDGVSVPNLPVGWTSTEAADPGNVGNPWATNATTPDTAPNDAFTNDPNNITDQRLDTPTIAITTGTAQLTFRNNFNLESTFDGGVLEISSPNINAGAFTDITAAAVGGSFVSGGYNGTISVSFGSPIAGRMAWTGNSNGYITTVANLGPNVAGQMIKLRFRMASDSGGSAVGWRVDTIRITDGFACSTCATQCTENFDSVTPPALPTGWSATVGATCANTARWVTVNTTSDTAPNSAFVNDPNCISDERLDSKPFPIVSAAAVLSFRRNNNLESGFDGMVLEISNPAVNAGAFQDIITAGGSFVTGGYNATISVNFGSPIAGRMAWSGNSGGFVTTTVNLPANANGQSIVLRWRRGSDSSVSAVGAFIDTISITGSDCSAVPCVLTCPANITKSNDPNQCGAVVTYPAPTTTGTCGTVTCSPASGSFFPVGTTTVTCSSSAGGATCTFTVTVQDTQPPTITCPPNVTAVTDQNACPPPPCVVGTFAAPTATDNCPGVTVLCNPPSGSCFPTGTTTVTCTATDASGNTATCSFTLTTFDTALQDDSDPSIILLWNSLTGAYRFCCNGTTFTGIGKSTIQGCVFTLQHNPADRRVLGRVDKAVHAGTASLQAPAGTIRCTITDRNTLNDTPTCQ